MKKNILVVSLIGLLLAFGAAVVGCDGLSTSSTTSSTSSGGGSGNIDDSVPYQR